MRVRMLVTLMACLGLPVLGEAQGAALQLPELKSLQDQAVESVNLTLGPELLDFVNSLPDGDKDVRRIRKAFREIKSVTVRSFKFAHDVHPGSELDEMRQKLNSPEWSPIVQAHDQAKSEDVNIYLAYSARAVRELVIMAVSPREITLVDVTGTLDPSQVQQLRHNLQLRID